MLVSEICEHPPVASCRGCSKAYSTTLERGTKRRKKEEKKTA
jgi:hypothetical protein